MKSKLTLLFIFFIFLAFGQEQKKDTIAPTKLDEVVITGQLSPQSVKKSVFEVKIISQATIEKQAGTTLSDLLNNELNLTITPNTGTGSSQVSFFGLDGQYSKVLIDGIPVVSDTGLGNNTDLTQINLANIKQIEIVEGSNAVTFGQNAVAGVINIITKKSTKYKWEIAASLQEETVGDEFEFYDKGRHIQSISIANNISDNLFASLTISRDDFAGFLDDQKGQYYNQSDDLRGYKWLPKEKLNIKTTLNYKKNNFNLFYSLEFFNENLDFFNPTVDQNIHVQTQIENPFAIDSEFNTKRFIHHLNANGNFKSGITYNISTSYQEQKKEVDNFQFFINQLTTTNHDIKEYLSLKVFYSKGTLSNFFKSKKYDFLVGYELSNQNGFSSSSVAGTLLGDDINSKLNNYDLFFETEYHATENLSIRPGIRYSFQSEFDNQLATSLSAKYRFKKGITLRNVIGTSYRTPNFEELFTDFVDSNHDVRGNKNLIPENSFSVFTHLNKDTWFNDSKIKLTNKIQFFYLDVSDRIILALVDANSAPNKFEYINIDKYKTFGFSLNNTIKYKNIKASLGFSYNGISQVLDSETDSKNDFLFAFDVNSNFSYIVPKWNTSLFISHKLTGQKEQFFQTTDTNGVTIFEKGKRESYNWLDASIQKKFYKNKVTTTLGVRNLLNVKEIETTFNDDLTIGYGTSYYLKLKYNLNI